MASRELTDTGYVLHRRRFRENSAIIEVLTAHHGLLGLVVRGKERTGSVPSEFRALHLVWAGKPELPSLVRAEPLERALKLTGERLFSGLYLNELVYRFIHRGDANPTLFAAYQAALGALVDHSVEMTLREFELTLLACVGYALQLNAAADTGLALNDSTQYYYLPEHGVVSSAPSQPSCAVDGRTLKALAGAADWEPEVARQAKVLMRFVIHHHLGGRQLATRELFKFSNTGNT
ncbi:MAG: DNA repair protein RecO [Gammaproteobacteria bacterium]|nr:DNA repair protein RecO [Gammaproteobacteria bacterium]